MFFVFFLPKNTPTADTEIFSFLFVASCVICVFVCVSLVSQGLADLWAPPLKQGDIGVKAAFVDTVHCESILPHLLIRTHSQTPSSSTTFSREAETRRPLEPRFIFNIAFLFLFFSTSVAAHRDLTPICSDFNPRNTSNHSPKCPLPSSLGSASPLQLLPRLFSSVVSLIFSPSPSSFSASSSSSGAVCTCLGVSLTLGNLSECSAAAVSWWSEGGRNGETERRVRRRRRRCSGCGDTTPDFIRVERHESVSLVIASCRRKVIV